MEDKLPDMINTDPSVNPNPKSEVNPTSVLQAVDLQFKPTDTKGNDKIEDISDIFNHAPKANLPEKSVDPTELNDIQQKLEKTEKQLSESSKEAISLVTEKNTYAPFVPLLEKMRQDPKLVAYVDDYLKTGGAPKSVIEKLNLSEDFVYDPDEAIKNPNSESAKALTTVIGDAIDSRFSTFQKEQNVILKRVTDDQKFRSEMKLDDKQWKDYTTFTNDKIKNLSHEDMYFLFNREEREKNIASTATKETIAQLNRSQKLSFPIGQGNIPTPDVDQEFKWYSDIFGDPRQKQDDVLIQ